MTSSWPSSVCSSLGSYMEVHRQVLQLCCRVDYVSSSILNRKNLTCSQVQIEIVSLGLLISSCSYRCIAFFIGVEDIAPRISWIIESCHILIEGVWEYRELEWFAEHDVVGHVCVGKGIFWVLVEHGLVEGATFLTDQEQLSVIVSNQMVSVPYSFGHYRHVSYVSFIDSLEGVWLLSESTIGIMVSREWTEGSYNGPSCAKLWGCVASKATDIGSSYWNTKQIHHHDTNDLLPHAGCCGLVIS